jgi:heat-inducible transcriptional repressor
MNTLTELGYLEQPHTSAGRLPTDKAYRYYVDHLIPSHKLAGGEELEIRIAYDQLQTELSRLLTKTSEILSRYSDCMGVVTSPLGRGDKILDLKLFPSSQHGLVIALTTDCGFVDTEVVRTEFNLHGIDLKRLSEELNAHLRGRRVAEITDETLTSIFSRARIYSQRFKDAFLGFLHDLITGRQTDVFYGGASKIISKEHPTPIEDLEGLLTVLEDKGTLGKMLPGSLVSPGSWFESNVRVLIGSENPVARMEGFSVIGASYRLANRSEGRLGIIGPKRMYYPRMIALIDVISRSLTEKLSTPTTR